MRRLGAIVVAISVLAFVGACDPGGTQTNCPDGQVPGPNGTCVPDDAGADADASGGDGSDRTDSGEEAGDTGPDPEPWADPDGDGVPNKVDNCPNTANPSQDDQDADTHGDACDNCPETANVDQKDSDGDGQGDLCVREETYDRDRDSDGDGVDDVDDNCVDTPNPGQNDPDGDGLGSKCDNCPNADNAPQDDSDNDGTGDACEAKPAGKICKRKSSNFQKVLPNFFFVIDRSSSMHRTDGTGTSRMKRVKNGLDQLANNLHDKARIGMSTFPCGQEWDTCTTLNETFLSVGKHSKSKIIASYRSNYSQSLCPRGSKVGLSGLDIEVSGIHGTETGSALKDVHQNNRHSDSSDSLDSKREKAVVLITDGCAYDKNNCTGEQSKAETWAAKMKNAGIPVYVVGFSTSCTGDLDAVARKGGTDAGASGGRRYYRASNASQLASALSKISSQVISCQYKVTSSQGIDPDKTWVEIDGNFVSPSEYSYDSSTNTLNLSQSACNKLQNASTSGSKPPLRIVAGCPSKCGSSEEICDFVDNDCDGEIDEGCEGCSTEVCNGKDDDCDGTTDEGCPGCVPLGDACGGGKSCCKGTCQDGTCRLCRPSGAACREDGQCCGGICTGSGGNVGRCTSG